MENQTRCPAAGVPQLAGLVLKATLLLCALFSSYTVAEPLKVTCGSTIKLMHASTKSRLHSHEVSYSRGSQQQSVTGYPDSDDAGSYWVVHGSRQESGCIPGAPLRKTDKVQLQHAATRKWLHSHRFQAPLSGNQEISAYGGDSSTDGGDVWSVEWDGKAKYWKQDAKVRLRHVDTGVFLHSHNMKFGQPINGQHEVCGVTNRDGNSNWIAAEGVYLPTDSGSDRAHDEL